MLNTDYTRLHEKTVYEVRLVAKEYLNDRVLKLKLDLGNQAVKMSPGDHLAIIPRNSNEAVSRLTSRLTMTRKDEKMPGYITVGGGGKDCLLQYYLLKN